MNRWTGSLVLAAVVGGLPAQLSVVVPTGMATAAGDTANAFPWGWSASGYTGLRHQNIYDSSNFTTQGVTSPILIQALRWRPDDSSGATPGGVFQQASVRMSTAPMDWAQQTTNFATNHGGDLTTVYSGAVTMQPTPALASWTVQTRCIDLQLATPFPYDPAAGDLVIDCEYLAGSWQGGALPSMDVQSSGALAGRTWGSTAYPNANGTWLNHGVVVELVYVPTAGYAYSTSYGQGCVETATATVYEHFGVGAFDLSNTSWQLIPTGNGYVWVSTTPSWHTPTSPPINFVFAAVSAPLSLGFQLAYPGGTTSAVYASSNGFVWAQQNTDPGCCGANPTELFSGPARWCPLWSQLAPVLGGQVQFDVDPANSAAYLTFTNVREVGPGGTVTFQVAFFASGFVEYRFQGCSLQSSAVLTGWTPGGTNDPGSIDISAAGAIVTQPDAHALRHVASARPVLGTTIQLRTSQVPAAATLGATVAGLVAYDPGIDLGPFGMPNCRQFVSPDAVIAWLPQAGVGATPFVIPNAAWLTGVVINAQGAALVPGLNAVGAATSNGMHLFLDVN